MFIHNIATKIRMILLLLLGEVNTHVLRRRNLTAVLRLNDVVVIYPQSLVLPIRGHQSGLSGSSL